MNIIKQFVKSLYSPKDIAKFRFQGIGKTIMYVFFLTLVSVLPTTYYFSTSINNGLNVAQKTIKDEIPPFSIIDGKLSTKSSTPIIIEKNDFTIILDPTGTIKKEDISDNGIALLKNEFLFMAGGKDQSYNYSMFKDIKVNNDVVKQFLNTMESLKYIFIPILFIIIYIFSSGVKFIEVSILAVFGLFIAQLLGKNVPYRQGWRIAAYCVTLPTLFFTIMACLQTTVSSGVLINWVVSMILLFLAIKEIPVKKK